MKENIIIKKENEIIYSGPILEVPIKKDVINQKSLEVFGDDEPCIIHQSFVVKEIVIDLINLFKKDKTKVIKGDKYERQLGVLDFEDISALTVELKG